MSHIRVALLVVVSLLNALSVMGRDALFVGLHFDTYFDNREYSQSSEATVGSFNDDSGTDFSARLTPYIKYKWSGLNSLVVGCELIENFGEVDSKFLASTLPVLYYKYETGNVRAAAGIFTRELIHSHSYSRAFFSEDYLFYNNLLSGFMGSYSVDKSFVELVVDWEGMRSSLSREKFRVLSAGRHYFGDFYYGYNATLFHFAKRDDGVHDNIVDYTMLNPSVGYNYSGVVDLEAKVGALISAQRDRGVGMEWGTPVMGEIALAVNYNGLYIANELYLGSNMNPYFASNGYELYPNEMFFRTEKGIYNRVGIGYENSFFKDTLKVKGEVALHYDGSRMASQYIIDLSVDILKRLYISNR